MNKKELMEIPIEAPEWLMKKEYTKNVYMVRDKWGEIRTYCFFKKESLKKGDDEPYVVIFKDKHTWLNYFPKENKFTKGSLDRGFFDIGNQWLALKNLRMWQRKIIEKRYLNKKAIENERTKVVMEEVGDVPEDFEEFCKEEVMKDANYLIYNNKKKKVYCTHCKEEYSIKELITRNDRKPKHGEKMMCDKCKVELDALSEGISRNGKHFGRSTEIIQKFRNGIIIREFNIYRSFEHSITPETKIWESRRHICERGNYRRYEYGVVNKRWRSLKKDQNFQNMAYYTYMLYEKNLKGILKGTVFEGHIVEWYLKNRKNERIRYYEDLFERAAEKPYLEQIYKSGLKELAKELFEQRYSWECEIAVKETKLTKMLNINKQQLEWLRGVRKDSIRALTVLQIANKNGRNLEKTEWESIRKSKEYYWEKRILEYPEISIEKCKNYCKKNGLKVNDFLDHVDLMKKLKIPVNKRTLYPSDFMKTHQDEVEQDILENSEVAPVQQALFEQTYGIWKEILKDVEMKSGAYEIIFPKGISDIKAEGRVLHHCVGGYAEKAASGKTVILFMRLQEEKEKRLYTMEYNNGKLIQIRAVCNGEPDPEAKRFAEVFAEQFKEAEEKFKEKMAG